MTIDSERTWKCRSLDLQLGQFPLIMGIVNVTPDSFSDGGRFYATHKAVEHALQLVDEGADILDIGGESTRPGAEIVPEREELERTIPVIRELAKRTSIPLSIDTTKSEVARQAIEAGAVIVNDISGLRFDQQMPVVCAEEQAGVICMHIQGTPQTMQDNPSYADVIKDICHYFAERISLLEKAGISRESIVLDPGVGFGKTPEHNLQILSHIRGFRNLGRPVLIGHSRKRFLQKILNRPVDERENGTLGISVALAAQQTDILRVHDVAATRDVLLAWKTIIDRCDH